jgi:hypothetical protein
MDKLSATRRQRVPMRRLTISYLSGVSLRAVLVFPAPGWQIISANLAPGAEVSHGHFEMSGASWFFRDVSSATRGQKQMPAGHSYPMCRPASHLPESGVAWSVRQSPSGVDSAIVMQFCSYNGQLLGVAYF